MHRSTEAVATTGADTTTPPPSPPNDVASPSTVSSLSADCILIAFELSAHSPYTLSTSPELLQYDLVLHDITADTRPIPFAAFPLSAAAASPAPFTLAALRSALLESLVSGAVAALSSQGRLTPHQAVALHTSEYVFLTADGQAVTEEAEQELEAAAFAPLLLLREASGQHPQQHHQSVSSGPQSRRSSTAHTPPTGPVTPQLKPSPGLSAVHSQYLFPSGAGDGIDDSGLPHDLDHAQLSSGISYSRAATLPVPVTRRGSLDPQSLLDTLSVLDGQLRRQSSTADFTHQHGLRPPSHTDSFVIDPTIQSQYTVSAPLNAPHPLLNRAAFSTPTSSLRRVAPQPDSPDLDEEEQEIAPADFPQPSAGQSRRPSFAQTADSAVTLPPSSQSLSSSSSSVPTSLHQLLDYLQQHSSPAASGPLSAERKASYNSMDRDQPSLLKRRKSAVPAAHQARAESRLNRSRSFTATRSQARAIAESRLSRTKTSAEEEHKREEGSDAAAAVRAQPLRRRGSRPKPQPHFHDQMNEYSSSSMRRLGEAEPPYRIVVIGERDAAAAAAANEQKDGEQKQSSAEAGAGERRHRKNIVSDLTQLSTRVGPIRSVTASASAASRVQMFDNVEELLRSRQDEKRSAQKHRVAGPLMPQSGAETEARKREAEMEPMWIAVEDAPASVIARIGAHFGLHPLTVEDCQSQGIREKLEVFTDYLFIVFHALDQTEDDDAQQPVMSRRNSEALEALSPLTMPNAAQPMQAKSLSNFSFSPSSAGPSSAASLPALASSSSSSALLPALLSTSELDLNNSCPVKVVIFPSCVLTFHRRGLRCVNKVRRQLQRLYSNRLDNTAWAVHALLDCIVDSLIPVVGAACQQADALEDNIYIPPADSAAASKKLLLRQMNLMGRRLAFLRQRMWSKRDILMSLIEKDWAVFLRGVKIPYLRDVYDHVETMLHRIDASVEVVDTIQSTYLSIVNIDVSVSAENVNKAMKKMSAAATIVLPLTLVTAIMGMNIFVPWQAADNLADPAEYPPNGIQLEPFIIMMALFLVFTVALCVYFKKVRYFSSRQWR